MIVCREIELFTESPFIVHYHYAIWADSSNNVLPDIESV